MLSSKIKLNLGPHLPALSLLLIAIVGVYSGINQTFYQQDEWQQLGLMRGGVISLNPLANFSLWQLLAGQGRYFSDLILAYFLNFHPFNLGVYSLVALAFHFINSALVYWLIYRLTTNKISSIVGALIFALSAVANQTVIWMAAISTLPAFCLIFLSIHSYITFLESDRRQWLWLSFGLFFISLFFKEIGIFLVVLLPWLYFVNSKKSGHSQLVQTLAHNWQFLAYGILAVIARLIQLSSATANGTIAGGGGNFILKVIFNLILYPLTALAQTLIPQEITYPVARAFTLIQYGFVKESGLTNLMSQTVVTDLLTIIISICLIWLLMTRLKTQTNGQLIVSLGLGLVMLSFLPYAVLNRGGSYMDSRYYYVAASGLGLLMGFGLELFSHWRTLGKYLALGIVLGLLILNANIIRTEITTQQKIANERRSILISLKSAVPDLSQNTVFYITGDQSYFVANNYLPFQQGIGYTLLVWYGDKTAVPTDLLAKKFLWELGSEEYRRSNDFAIGYFSQIKSLKEAYLKDNFPLSNIRGFYWDSHRQELSEISDSVRDEVAN